MSLFKYQNQNSSQPQIIRSVSYPRRTHAVTQRQRPQPKHYQRVPAFLVLAAVLLGVFFIVDIPLGKNGNVQGAQTHEVEAAPKPEPVKQLNFTTMNAAIDSEIGKYPYMDIGVAVVDIKTGDSQTYGVENPFVAASTAKLLTAIAFLHDVEEGTATLSQQVGARSAEEALQAMIIDSDNAAWNDFNNSVMSHAQLAAFATKIGLEQYNPDTNTITPASVAKLLSNLYQNKLLNKEHTDLLLSYMQQAKEVEFITNAVPSGVKVYHKPGYLTDRIHDATIIDDGNRPYVLVIFSKSRSTGYNAVQGEALFKQVTLATTATFIR